MNRNAEAAETFQEVLRRDPAHELAELGLRIALSTTALAAIAEDIQDRLERNFAKGDPTAMFGFN